MKMPVIESERAVAMTTVTMVNESERCYGNHCHGDLAGDMPLLWRLLLWWLSEDASVVLTATMPMELL